MNLSKRKIIGLVATTAAIAAGPAAGSAAANWSLSGATVVEGGNLAFTINANCENGILPCIDERFSYSVESGSAKTGGDLPATSSAVLLSSIPWGNNTRVVELPTNDDSIDEPDSETVTIRVSHSGKFGSADRETVGTILDNDAEPEINSVTGPTTVNEGTGGTRSVPVKVHLSAASEKTITRSYHTNDGTATSPADYQSTSGSAEFGPGETEKTINVPIVTDSVDENDENFSFETGNAGLSIKILDDDATTQTPPPGNTPPPGGNNNNQNPGNGGQAQSPAPQAVSAPQQTTQRPSSTTPAPKAKAKAKKCKKGSVRKGKGSKAKCVKKKASKKARR